ncbi:hypothetical protein [Pseudaminobacter soli (ex Li et al. 2025)]|uniref:Uncharacterized protein n=1 Tax=Pseudaminobacter soli (ex Li et al. 2025) TaxID=1295366 RepID=A0A2P7S582_9HYPH|nr:hypothetical protein [Mesorhizobium soli]PSJ57601.1 hypothetical protein C7I85_21785 [Mesorhizobium soli]
MQAKVAEQESADADDVDHTLTKWSVWLDAHREFGRLCRVQQRLETELLRTIESPQVALRLPDRKNPIIAHTEDEIEAWLAGDECAEARARAREELAARRRTWNAGDEVIGFSRAKEAEAIASDLEVGLVEELWATPAGTVTAAAAKLHSIIKQGAPEPDTDDFPWPQVRSVLIDLLGMSGASRSVTRDPG